MSVQYTAQESKMGWHIYDKFGKRVATVNTGQIGQREIAALFAAAPDLLGAVRSVMEYHENPGHGNGALPEHWSALRAALKKATP